MDTKELIKTSKFLSLVLRHNPEKIGITLDENGWTNVNELMIKLSVKGHKINIDSLKWVVENNNKKRFAVNEDFSKIRANQGHSVEIDLNYESKMPPEHLYHGTATKNLSSILAIGLKKQNRHHVHLSIDKETVINVGSRHGKPVVLIIKSKEMHEKGINFFLSANGVWLVDEILPEFIDVEP
jgi:putative RNA 2'-phosphotransferase